MHEVASLRVKAVVLVKVTHVFADGRQSLLAEPDVVTGVGPVVEQQEGQFQLAEPFILVVAVLLKFVGTVLPRADRPVGTDEVVAPGLNALGDVGTAVVQVLARAFHAEIKKPEVQPEERMQLVKIAGGEHGIVRQARVLPPVAAAPAAVVGIAFVRDGEDRPVEAYRQTATSRAGGEIALRGVGRRNGGALLGHVLAAKVNCLDCAVHHDSRGAPPGHNDLERDFPSGRQFRRMRESKPSSDEAHLALVRVNEETVASPRRDVVEQTLRLLKPVRREPAGEAEYIALRWENGRPAHCDHLARLRDARIDDVAVELDFRERERAEKAVVALGIDAEAQRQLVVRRENDVLARLGRDARRRSHVDVAAVPELRPRRHVLGALRILVCKVPSVLVEHPVRAAQPFRLVLAGM